MSLIPEVDYSKNKMDRPNDCIDDDNFRRGWQAGADAILETLKRQAHLFQKVVVTEATYDSKQKIPPGFIIFIPDDTTPT